MPLAIRCFDPASDYPHLAAWMRRVKGDARDAATWQRQDETGGAPEMVRLVAERDGAWAGWGQSWLQRQARPGTHSLTIHAGPAQQPPEVRAALYEALLKELAAKEPVAVRAEIQETDEDALAFFATRGFAEVNREWESRLEVAGFDFSRFRATEERCAQHGVTITTFEAEDAATSDADAAEALRRAVHAMEVACARDDPSNEGDDRGMPYPAYVRAILGNPDLMRDGYFLARHGDRFVGVSNLFRSPSDPVLLKQGLTGVLPEYRRRGIATTLKLATVRYAQAHGYRQISTRNNTRNRPMLAINEAMGFQKEPAWVTMEKVLS